MLLLILFVTLFSCAIAWIYIKWKSVRDYWNKRGVPHLPPHPLLGSLTFLMRENPGKWMRRMREICNSPYMGIWLFWRPGLLINSPDLAKDILVKDWAVFRDRFVSSGESDPLGGLNLFTVNDPIWTPIRRRLSTVFTAAKLRCLQDYMHLKSKQLVERISNERYVISDVRTFLVDYTTDVIGTSAFGVESNATLTGKGALRGVTKEFSKYSLFRGLSVCSIFFFPDLVNIFRFKFYPKSSEAYFRNIYHTIVAQRKAANENKSQDLLDLLLQVKEDSKLAGEAYSDDLLIAQAAVFLFGGYESSATLLTFTTLELAYCPEIQEKLYEELVKAKEENGSDVFEAQTLAELQYLNCILKEALRKYAPMGWLDRVAATDYRINDSLTIEAGTVVYINTNGMHFNPEYFPNPDLFDPDRFLPENEKKIPPYSYMPFGEGPRFCIGKRFGLMTSRFALSSLILNYKIRPGPNTPKPNDLKIIATALLYLPEEQIAVEFVPRNKFKFYPKSSEAYFRNIYHTIVAQRKAANGNKNKDLLDLLLKVKEDSELAGEAYSDDFLIAQAAVFLFGGYESSATLMTFTICELAHCPEIQEKLYEELVKAKEKNGSNVFEAQTLAELKYLNCVLKEGLRKYAPMGWLDRVAATDYRVDDSLTIEAGTVVYINTNGMHFDPEYFPDPDTFDPDRFLPENEKKIPPYSYLPFGEGPRFCIGKRFGLMTSRFALSSLILNYRIRPGPNTPKPNDLKIDTTALLYLPGEQIAAEFIPRN